MFARLFLTVLAAAGLTLGAAAPAHAKGPTDAQIAGPGLAARIVVPQEKVAPLMEATFADRLLYSSPSGVEFSDTAADTDRGAGYRVEFLMGQDVVLGLTVHPHADGGPLVYVPPKQGNVFLGSAVETGWIRAPKETQALLVELGVPPRADERAGERAGDDRADPLAEAREPVERGGRVLGVGGAVAAAAVGLWLYRRRRAATV